MPTYKKARKYGIDITVFGSESATIFEYGGRQIIFYDDSKLMTHVKYSILHELGHPLNNHDFSVTDKEFYGRYEVETNYFAAQLLMPEQVLRELTNRGIRITKEFLMQHFEVSETAAKSVLKRLLKQRLSGDLDKRKNLTMLSSLSSPLLSTVFVLHARITLILRTSTTVSAKGTLGTNHTAELHIGGDAYGCDTEKEKAFRKLLQQQTKCLVPCRICYDNRLDCLFIIAYPDPLVNLSSKKSEKSQEKY